MPVPMEYTATWKELRDYFDDPANIQFHAGLYAAFDRYRCAQYPPPWWDTCCSGRYGRRIHTFDVDVSARVTNVAITDTDGLLNIKLSLRPLPDSIHLIPFSCERRGSRHPFIVDEAKVPRGLRIEYVVDNDFTTN